VPLDTAKILSRRLVDKLKLQPWASESTCSFESEEEAKAVTPARDILECHYPTSRSHPGGDERVVSVNKCLLPPLRAWQSLMAELKQDYQEFCRQGPSRVQGTHADAPQPLGHYLAAMEAILPKEMWQMVSAQTTGAAAYYRMARQTNSLCRDVSMEEAGGDEMHADFFCCMCAFAWAEVAPSLGSITIESAGAIRPREILVTVSSCLDANPVLTTADASMVEVQEQASGMGGPFGLSVDTAGTETL